MVNGEVDALAILQDLLPDFISFLCAIALTSLVILISHSFDKLHKVAFQVFCLGSGFAACLSYLIFYNDAKLVLVWKYFIQLTHETRFCLSIILIVAVYFGGAMYIAPADEPDKDVTKNILSTPASCDQQIGFRIPTNVPEDDTQFFVLIFDKICKEILDDLPVTYELPSEAHSWVKRMMSYTVDGGKMNRGLSTVSVRKTFAKATGYKLSIKERCQAAALGWCIEFLQAFFLVADDVMDDSVTRRGQPCWFRREEVKLIAINDSFILESFVYKILKKYFGDEYYYYQLVDLFIEVTRQTEFGQLLDLTSQRLGGPIDLDRFTIERYISIVKYKTSFYSFYLPVACGMIVSGITDVELYNKAREILLIMGEYFQIQDDYLDCYGAPEVIGKIGTDIQDNKCSWLVVQALSLVTKEQRHILEENYGQHDPKNVEIIKNLYNDLNLEDLFKTYEEDSYKKIQKLLKEVKNMPIAVFEFLLNKIYKRSK